MVTWRDNLRSSVEQTPVGDRQIVWSLVEPAADQLAQHPALLVGFTDTGPDALAAAPDDGPIGTFLGAGHRVISVDIPCHGRRVAADGPQGLDGLCAAVAEGYDPFRPFVEGVMAVIDACIGRGIAHAGRIFLAGTSRFGYAALRLAAADHRVGGVAAYAPVVDWRLLREFEPVKDTPLAASLALECYADQLAGRPILIAIGETDERVSTAHVKAFSARLGAVPWGKDSMSSTPGGPPVLVIDPTAEGHAVSPRSVLAGADFLLRLAAS